MTGYDGAGFRPLDGVRVVDFTRVLAGPYATMVLAEIGADGRGGGDRGHRRGRVGAIADAMNAMRRMAEIKPVIRPGLGG